MRGEMGNRHKACDPASDDADKYLVFEQNNIRRIGHVTEMSNALVIKDAKHDWKYRDNQSWVTSTIQCEDGIRDYRHRRCCIDKRI